LYEPVWLKKSPRVRTTRWWLPVVRLACSRAVWDRSKPTTEEHLSETANASVSCPEPHPGTRTREFDGKGQWGRGRERRWERYGDGRPASQGVALVTQASSQPPFSRAALKVLPVEKHDALIGLCKCKVGLRI